MSSSTATIEFPMIRSHARRWTSAEFDALLNDGYLREGSKTYLWDGEIIEPVPENQPHVHALENLNRAFFVRLPEADWTTGVAHPLALREGYKPQPDYMVLVGPRAEYRRRVPTPADVALLVEIADSSYAEDVVEKLPEYAAALIPRYWIVNLRARRFESYSHPLVASGVGRYASRVDYSLDQALPLVLNQRGESYTFEPIAVADVLRDSLEDAGL